eukprot:IDg11632t1
MLRRRSTCRARGRTRMVEGMLVGQSPQRGGLRDVAAYAVECGAVSAVCAQRCSCLSRSVRDQRFPQRASIASAPIDLGLGYLCET